MDTMSTRDELNKINDIIALKNSELNDLNSKIVTQTNIVSENSVSITGQKDKMSDNQKELDDLNALIEAKNTELAIVSKRIVNIVDKENYVDDREKYVMSYFAKIGLPYQKFVPQVQEENNSNQ